SDPGVWAVRALCSGCGRHGSRHSWGEIQRFLGTARPRRTGDAAPSVSAAHKLIRRLHLCYSAKSRADCCYLLRLYLYSIDDLRMSRGHNGLAWTARVNPPAAIVRPV